MLLLDHVISTCRDLVLGSIYWFVKPLYKNKDLVIQNSGKGNSAVIVDRHDYITKAENILNNQDKFTKVNLKDNTLLNLSVNQEKHADKFLKTFLRLTVWQKRQVNC